MLFINVNLMALIKPYTLCAVSFANKIRHLLTLIEVWLDRNFATLVVYRKIIKFIEEKRHNLL